MKIKHKEKKKKRKSIKNSAHNFRFYVNDEIISQPTSSGFLHLKQEIDFHFLRTCTFAMCSKRLKR